MSYTLPELPYDYSALEPHISGQIVELHHDKHHKTYVDEANATLERLEAARASGEFDSIVGLEKTLAFNVSGHVLHSIYWQNTSPDGGGLPAVTTKSACGRSDLGWATIRLVCSWLVFLSSHRRY